MLMFAKLSLMSFICELVEIFYFPDKTFQKIYQKCLIEKVYIYHVLTSTDSTCLKLVLESSTHSNIPGRKLRNRILNIFRHWTNLVWNFIFIKKKKENETDSVANNVMGEKNIFNKLSVMDDVSGLADRSNNFPNSLTAGRKFNFASVYVFHTIYHSRPNWQMIFSETRNFNIFPGSLQTISVAKILSSYYNRYTYEYIPHRDVWINRLYFKISISTEKMSYN